MKESKGLAICLPRALKYFTWLATASVALSLGQTLTPFGNRIDLRLLSSHLLSASVGSKSCLFLGGREGSMDFSGRSRETARVGSCITSEEKMVCYYRERPESRTRGFPGRRGRTKKANRDKLTFAPVKPFRQCSKHTHTHRRKTYSSFFPFS